MLGHACFSLGKKLVRDGLNYSNIPLCIYFIPLSEVFLLES